MQHLAPLVIPPTLTSLSASPQPPSTVPVAPKSQSALIGAVSPPKKPPGQAIITVTADLAIFLFFRGKREMRTPLNACNNNKLNLLPQREEEGDDLPHFLKNTRNSLSLFTLIARHGKKFARSGERSDSQQKTLSR
jgi:hypothetical protein